MTGTSEGRSQERVIAVEALARVEGEGGLHVVVEDGIVRDVQLKIFEPPRFFEALLRGRPLEDAPDITARICGICPIAYQMSCVHALEHALGIAITPEIRRLRRLLYCGEWIESHGVHIFLLHLPDFFGCASSIELARRFPQEVQRGLRLKKIGNRLLEVLGGRAVHPVNVTVGGFHRVPKKAELDSLLEDLRWGLDAAIETARWLTRLEYPDFHPQYEFVSLQHPREYPMNEGRVTTSRGLSIAVTDFEQHFAECHVPHSTALQSLRIPENTPYFVGPLARVHLNRDRLSPAARQLSGELGIDWPCFNPYRSILARGLEMVHAYEEALDIITDYRAFQPGRLDYQPKASEGMAATEAPRGMIYHRYQVDDQGHIALAKIVPPTSQNQRQIECDLQALIGPMLDQDDESIARRCEQYIRNYDPCISCSTHFLRLSIERR